MKSVVSALQLRGLKGKKVANKVAVRKGGNRRAQQEGSDSGTVVRRKTT
jgi:hypothetical protein